MKRMNTFLYYGDYEKYEIFERLENGKIWLFCNESIIYYVN